jgi:hypothetical protein
MPSSVSATRDGWRLVACQVLPDLARTAATRSHLQCLCEAHQRDPLALLPVARSPSRTHCCARWWALTPPFQPLPLIRHCALLLCNKQPLVKLCCSATTACVREAGLLSVAVVVRRSNCARPHLLFREATWPLLAQDAGKSGSSSTLETSILVSSAATAQSCLYPSVKLQVHVTPDATEWGVPVDNYTLSQSALVVKFNRPCRVRPAKGARR